MSAEVVNAEPKVARIVDAIYSLRVDLPVSERDLIYALDRVSRVCLEQISADLTSSSAERRSEGVSHLMEHLEGTFSLEQLKGEKLPPEEPEQPDETPEVLQSINSPAAAHEALSQELEESLEIPDELPESDYRSTINLREYAPVAREPLKSVDSAQAPAPVIAPEVQERSVRKEVKIYPEKSAACCSHSKAAPAASATSPLTHPASGAGRQLINHLSEISCLQSVRKELDAYFKTKAEGERAKLARRIIEKLWEDRRMDREIRELFSVSDGFEQALEVAFSRNHYARQLETYLLGCLVLHELEPELRKSGRLGILGRESNSIYLTWLMASSIHDTGYPMEYGRQIVDRLSRLYSSLGMDHYAHLFSSVDAQFSGMPEQQNLSIEQDGSGHGYLNIPEMVAGMIMNGSYAEGNSLRATVEDKWNRQDHGLAGAAILARALLPERVRLDEASTELAAFKSAATALALHNFGPDELRFSVDFDRLPYAFLLMVVNELQEWSTPAGSGHSREACFNLSSAELIPAAGRRVIKLTFAMPPNPGPDTLQALRDQISSKRRKLANLNYSPAEGDCDEIEINAAYTAGSEQLGHITVLLLHGA